MTAADRLGGPAAAASLQRLCDAALADEQGHALHAALATLNLDGGGQHGR
jgi:hypothetical protein